RANITRTRSGWTRTRRSLCSIGPSPNETREVDDGGVVVIADRLPELTRDLLLGADDAISQLIDISLCQFARQAAACDRLQDALLGALDVLLPLLAQLIEHVRQTVELRLGEA